jgi:rod shape-determining protein MreD
MGAGNIVFQVGSFFFYVLFQVVFLKNLSLFNYAFCFAYVMFLLSLPLEVDRILQMGIAFATGFTIDVFYDTLGIHAAACVLIVYVRKYVLDFFKPIGGYEQGAPLTVSALGLPWFVRYAASMVFIHHLALFMVSASNLEMLGFTVLKAMASTLFTTMAIVLMQYFPKLYALSRKRRRV